MFLYIIIFKVTPKSYSGMNEPLCTTFNNVQAVVEMCRCYLRHFDISVRITHGFNLHFC